MAFDYYDLNPGTPLMQQQLFSEWCWVASTLFVCEHYNTAGITQPQLAALILNNPICNSGVPYPPCNVKQPLDYAFSMVGHLNGGPVDRPLSADELISAFNATKNPIGCQMDLPSIGGHAVVLINATADAMGKCYVKIGDPGDGSINTMPYDLFRNNYRGHGGYWLRSYYTI